MNIVLTGATGYVGSAVVKALLAHGHDVTALVRSDESAKAVEADRVTPVVGDITDVSWLTDQLRSGEGAIDLAELYVAVLEKAPGGDMYIGVSGASPTVKELGEAYAGVGKTVEETPEESRERLGTDFADALLLDQQATGNTAKNLFSWTPKQ